MEQAVMLTGVLLLGGLGMAHGLNRAITSPFQDEVESGIVAFVASLALTGILVGLITHLMGGSG